MFHLLLSLIFMTFHADVFVRGRLNLSQGVPPGNISSAFRGDGILNGLKRPFPFSAVDINVSDPLRYLYLLEAVSDHCNILDSSVPHHRLTM